jgi:hypothetical protein
VARQGVARQGEARAVQSSQETAMKKYKFRPGSSVRGVSAQDAGEELERIRQEHDGKLLTDDILSEAARPENVLHPHFVWDDQIAGREYRRWQARMLPRSIRIVVDAAPEADEPAFVHVHVKDSKEQRSYYQSTRVAIANPLEYLAATRALVDRFNSAQQALDDLQRVANASEYPERAAQLRVVAEALALARTTTERLH